MARLLGFALLLTGLISGMLTNSSDVSATSSVQ